MDYFIAVVYSTCEHANADFQNLAHSKNPTHNDSFSVSWNTQKKKQALMPVTGAETRALDDFR